MPHEFRASYSLAILATRDSACIFYRSHKGKDRYVRFLARHPFVIPNLTRIKTLFVERRIPIPIFTASKLSNLRTYGSFWPNWDIADIEV